MAKKSTIKYHINPTTGQPSICRATIRECPYGDSPHYSTWDEAQEASDKMMAKRYGLQALTPEERTVALNAVNWDTALKKSNWPKDKITIALRYTDHPELIAAALAGQVEGNATWADSVSVLLNEHMPDSVKIPLMEWNNYWTPEALAVFAAGPVMSEEEILKFIENSDDKYVQAIAYTNPKLSKETIKKITDKDRAIVKKLPYIGLLMNPNTPPRIINDYRKELDIIASRKSEPMLMYLLSLTSNLRK